MEFVNIFLGIELVLSLFLVVISLLAYLREKNFKILLVSLSFLAFFAKSVYYTYFIFKTEVYDVSFITNSIIMDIVILLLLFISTLKG